MDIEGRRATFRGAPVELTFREFAMLETYQAYGTYDDSATMTREVIQEVAMAALGTAGPLTDRPATGCPSRPRWPSA